MRSIEPGISRFRARSFGPPRDDEERPGKNLRRRGLEQPFRGCPCLGGDLGAGKHAGDLLAAVVGGERVDAGGDALALVERILGNQEMLIGSCRDLRRMRHRHHLHLAGQPRQPRADRVRDRAADTGIDFIEHERRRRAPIGQHDFQRQQKARQFAAGGDFHQRPRPGARIGLHPELDPVEALRPRRIGIAVDLRREFRAIELQGRKLGIHGLVELLRRFDPRGAELRGGRGITLIGFIGRGFELFQLLGAGIDQRDVGGVSHGERGERIDRVEFWVQTNPGTRPGPLMKIASGGELARFLLALKVVLADRGSAPTLIFDEIDTGVGGATADAIGARLAQLSSSVQVIAVTHAPQVAARADRHYLISKDALAKGKRVATRVTELEAERRREEIARMLAGAEITAEARAAAERLIRAAG